MKLVGTAMMALAVLGTNTGLVIAQPTAAETVAQVRVFEGPT